MRRILLDKFMITGKDVINKWVVNPIKWDETDACSQEPKLKDGFFKTGDLARVDDSGIITLTGRIKETILRGGETISAVGIEQLISSHPSVADVAVIGMPDPDLGERVCAYVVVKWHTQLSFDDIIAFLKQAGASVMQLPERIEFVSAIPLTKIGKADKNMLKKDIIKKLPGRSL
ncbi:MAG TPA: hypothetical protein VMT71_18285 [Syntrophorhabdales bacterium]|nr:hypothetical protein [Syntrophorhabdales bacterium]